MRNDTGNTQTIGTAVATILPARLKVLHIISGDLWAGAEVQAFTLLRSLKEECNLRAAIMNPGELEQRLQAEGITVDLLDETKLSPLQILNGIIKLIKDFKPDIIHTHRQKENILGTIANYLSQLPRLTRAPSVRTVHGAPEHNANGLKKLVIKLDLACGNHGQDAIISVSNDLSRKLESKFKPGHIHTIHNGINVEQLLQISPATDIRINAEGAVHIGIIGRLEPVKRVDIFLRTAAYLCVNQQIPNLQFHVIGDGKLKTQLHTLAQELGLTDKVRFHGHRSDSQAAIAALDVIIMCSDHEGTPMTALETLALGKPLIAHNVGGLAEILEQEPRLLVSDHSPEGYAHCLKNLLQDPCIPQLPSHYRSHHNAQLTLQLYKKVAIK